MGCFKQSAIGAISQVEEMWSIVRELKGPLDTQDVDVWVTTARNLLHMTSFSYGVSSSRDFLYGHQGDIYWDFWSSFLCSFLLFSATHSSCTVSQNYDRYLSNSLELPCCVWFPFLHCSLESAVRHCPMSKNSVSFNLWKIFLVVYSGRVSPF